ncbi:AMP-binding enzyme family protein, partial [Vibrio parahaemolyticus V-223/04]
ATEIPRAIRRVT